MSSQIIVMHVYHILNNLLNKNYHLMRNPLLIFNRTRPTANIPFIIVIIYIFLPLLVLKTHYFINNYLILILIQPFLHLHIGIISLPIILNHIITPIARLCKILVPKIRVLSIKFILLQFIIVLILLFSHIVN